MTLFNIQKCLDNTELSVPTIEFYELLFDVKYTDDNLLMGYPIGDLTVLEIEELISAGKFTEEEVTRFYYAQWRNYV